MRRPLLVSALMLLGTLAVAQDASRWPTKCELQPGSAVAVNAESERKLQVAFDYLYNLDFDPALRVFSEVSDAEPSSASAVAFWSSALLYRMLAQQGSLQSQLFVTNEFFRRSPPPVDPELEGRYLSVRADAESRAERRLQETPGDIDGLFALGLVYGNTANYLAGVKGEYLSGLRLGERAYDLHARLREMCPDIHDTGVVLGVHEYVIGTLPHPMRFLLFLGHVRGNREEGFKYMQDAASRGEFLGPYAKVLLAMASIRENDLTTATSLAEDLVTRYPRNPLLRLELLKMYRQQRRYDEAEQLAHGLLDGFNPDAPKDALLERVRTEALVEIETIDDLRR